MATDRVGVDGASDLDADERKMFQSSVDHVKELVKAVKMVIQGRRYVSASLAELLVNDLDVDAQQPIHAQLSEREFQIFCKIAVGKSVSDIAEELCLSVKTVSTYRSRVLEKMSFTSNADITSYALRNGLMQ